MDQYLSAALGLRTPDLEDGVMMGQGEHSGVRRLLRHPPASHHTQDHQAFKSWHHYEFIIIVTISIIIIIIIINK